MKDRIPTPGQEGRMLITPENGDPPFYATVAMADNPSEDGTPLHKATLLKDATAALFELTNTAVPDDVLAWLGKYNQHWWERTVQTALYGYKEKRTLYDLTLHLVYYRGNSHIQYSDSITIDQETGEVTLVNPTAIVIPDGTTDETLIRTTISTLKGKYFTGAAATDFPYNAIAGVFFVPDDATGYLSKDTDTGEWINVYFDNDSTYKVTSQLFNHEPGEKDVVWATDRNAYPDSGLLDNFEYEYLGIPFSNAVTAPKVEIGSYVGTGLYGASNPNKLTFSFAPRFVIVSRFTGIQWVYTFHLYSDSYSISYDSSTWCDFIATWGGNVLSWYTDSTESDKAPTFQANQAGATYFYIAIG